MTSIIFFALGIALSTIVFRVIIEKQKQIFCKELDKQSGKIKNGIQNLIGNCHGIVAPDANHFNESISLVKQDLAEYFGAYMQNYNAFTFGLDNKRRKRYWDEYCYLQGTLTEIQKSYDAGCLKPKVSS